MSLVPVLSGASFDVGPHIYKKLNCHDSCGLFGSPHSASRRPTVRRQGTGTGTCHYTTHSKGLCGSVESVAGDKASTRPVSRGQREGARVTIVCLAYVLLRTAWSSVSDLPVLALNWRVPLQGPGGFECTSAGVKKGSTCRHPVEIKANAEGSLELFFPELEKEQSSLTRTGQDR